MTVLTSDIKENNRAFITVPKVTFYPQSKPFVNSISSYFLVTNLKSSKFSFTKNIVTYDIIKYHNNLAKQLDIISLSKKMFAGSMPMSGKELIVLKKTASRMISKTPTSLNK